MKTTFLNLTKTLSLFITLFLVIPASYAYGNFGKSLCNNDYQYECVKVRGGQSWESMFPNLVQRDLVMRVNRINKRLYPGLILAVPKDLASATIYSVSPFALKIPAPGQKEVIVDLNQLAWAAYDANGDLILWGPASGGKGYCPDVQRECVTVTGTFKIFRKQPAKCVSSVFPIEWDGGAPMPFCMHFHEGYALHGSYDVPGYNASHGCVRLFINDARWLNEQFTTIGTRVVVLPYEPQQRSW
jgi:lipoprotein-anchoring transpeptidase ErfK/SrfK